MITLIQSSFLEHKLTILRNKKTSNSLFRRTMDEVSYLIAADVLKFLTYKNISVRIQMPLPAMVSYGCISSYSYSKHMSQDLRMS